MTNKKFWRTDKPFSTNNGCISNNFIGIENYGNVISNEKEEKFSAKKTLSLRNSPDASQDGMIVKKLFPYIVIILVFEKSKIFVSLKINLICH